MASGVSARAEEELPLDEAPPTSDPLPPEAQPADPGAPADPGVVADPNAPVDPNVEPVLEPAQIEARYYDVSVVRPSESKRVYLLSKPNAGMPDIGRVILIKQNGIPVMGFRVLRVYPEKQEIAAKTIKKYEGYDELPVGELYRAYEKKGVITVIPENTPDDLTDLNDLEGGGAGAAAGGAQAGDGTAQDLGVQNPDGNFENGPPPETSLPPGSGDSTGQAMDQNINVGESSYTEEEEPDDDEVDYTEDEMISNMLSFDAGVLRGQNMPGGNMSLGGGFTYSRYLGTRIFDVTGRGAPDALALELGLYYYKNSGDVDIDGTIVSQAFTVMPLSAKLRYHFSLSSEKTGFYMYGGILYNRISSQIGATEEEVALAQTAIPAFGIGAMIPTGPGWFLKLNAGTDFIGAGIALRF